MATLYKVLSGSHRATVKGVRVNVPAGKLFVGPDGLALKFSNRFQVVKTAPDRPEPAKDSESTGNDSTPETTNSGDPTTDRTVEERLLAEGDAFSEAEPETASSVEELEEEADDAVDPNPDNDKTPAPSSETADQDAPPFDYKASQYYDELSKMTVAQLKTYAEESEVSLTGAAVKEDYIRLISAHLEG